MTNVEGVFNLSSRYLCRFNDFMVEEPTGPRQVESASKPHGLQLSENSISFLDATH